MSQEKEVELQTDRIEAENPAKGLPQETIAEQEAGRIGERPIFPDRDNLRVDSKIYKGLLSGTAIKSPFMRVLAFVLGVVALLPLVYTLLNPADVMHTEVANLMMALVLAVPGCIIIYRAVKG